MNNHDPLSVGAQDFDQSLKKIGYKSILDFDHNHETMSYLELTKLLAINGVTITPVVLESILGEVYELNGQVDDFIRKSLFRHIIRSFNDRESSELDWQFKITNAVAACASRLPDSYSNRCLLAWNKLKASIDDTWLPSTPNHAYLLNAFKKC